MEQFYRIYDYYLRLRWGSLLYLPIGIAAGMGAYLCTGETKFFYSVSGSVIFLRLSWVVICCATLRCPHCGRRSLALVPVLWDIFHAAYGVREYKMYCWRCKHSCRTDLATSRRSRDLFPCRTRGEAPPDAFTKRHALNTLFITIAACLILLAISRLLGVAF